MVPFLPHGRVARVPKVGVRGAASAAGGPRDYHQPCEVLNRVSRVVHAGSIDESVPVWLLRASHQTLRVHRLPTHELHEPHQRTAIGPHRLADPGATCAI